jgi:hypothetical protein
MAAESSAMVLFLAFTSALGMVLFDKLIYKIATVAIGFLIGLFFQKINLFIILFAVLLPTIIHVFVFTALFIIQGALKNKSLTGLLSVGFFVLCAVAFFVLDPTFDFYHVSIYAKENLVSTNFAFVNQVLLNFWGIDNPTIDSVFYDQGRHAVMRLIAFAYTYHYLNWFSKTSVIKWHEVPKAWLITTAILWVGSVSAVLCGLYARFTSVFCLSMLHVFLEFPLNFRSMQGIGQSVSSLLFQNKKG